MHNRSETEPLLPASTSANSHPHVGSNGAHNTDTGDHFFKPNPIIAIRQAGHASRPGHVSIWRVLLVFALVVIPLLLLADLELPDLPWPGSPVHKQGLCPQVDALYPTVHEKVAKRVIGLYESPEFLRHAVESLSGAVKIPYVLYISFVSVSITIQGLTTVDKGQKCLMTCG